MNDRRIHITRQGVSYGPYPESGLEGMLAKGQLLPTDLAWCEGDKDWRPLQDFLGAKAAGTPSAVHQEYNSKEKFNAADPAGKIRVLRNGEAIGPYSPEKAMEYFIAGQLLPTDAGCVDETGDNWKPLNEILGLPVSIPTNSLSGAKNAKGKKRAVIAGISVLVIGLITVGILYGPKLLGGVDGEGLLGGGKEDVSKNLAERVVKALKDNDKDAMFELSNFSWSRGDLEKLHGDMEKAFGGFVEDQQSFVSDFENEREQAREGTNSGVEYIRSMAIEDGLNWSDVTVSEVKTLGLPGSPEEMGFSVRVYVSITSNSKEFTLWIDCMYAPSVGLFMIGGRPSWEGQGGIGSWGLASNSMAQRANEILSERNIKDLGKGVGDYADINKKLPAANNWCDVIFKEMGGGKAFISIQAPNAKKLNPNEKHCHYAMNAAVVEKQSDEIRRPIDDKKIVVLFEADLGWNGVGNLEDAKKFAKDYKPRKLAVFFGDGSSELVSPEELDQLKWNP